MQIKIKLEFRNQYQSVQLSNYLKHHFLSGNLFSRAELKQAATPFLKQHVS